MIPPASDSAAPLVWKTSPGGAACYLNAVAVSDDGGTVIGGTLHHPQGASVARRSGREGWGMTDARGADGPLETMALGAYCYDRDGALRWSNAITGWEGVHGVAVSGDGRYAAAGGNYSSSPPAGFVRAYDAGTGAILLDHRTGRCVNQVALSADGTWLVAAAESVLLFCHVPGTAFYTRVAEYPAERSPEHEVNRVGLSDDGTTIVFSDSDGRLGVLSNSGGTLVPMKVTPLPGGAFCRKAALSADGKRLVGAGANGRVLVFDTAAFLQSGEPRLDYETGASCSIHDVAIDGEGRRVAAVVRDGAGGSVHLLGIADGAAGLLGRIETTNPPNAVSLNAARGLLAVSDGHPDGTPGALNLYREVNAPTLSPSSARSTEVTTERLWSHPTPSNPCWPIAIARDGSAVVGGSDDSFLYYFSGDVPLSGPPAV